MKIHTQEPTMKVTRVGKRWHARLMLGKVVHSEMACQLRQDIGWVCRELLRWYDKLGGTSKFAKAARKRQSKTPNPVGQVWRF